MANECMLNAEWQKSERINEENSEIINGLINKK